MAAGFSFGFDDDDVADDTAQDQDEGEILQNSMQDIQEGNLQQIQVHQIQDLLSTLPDQITYSDITLPIQNNGTSHRLYKRDLHDIRAQIMAEDEGLEKNNSISGLSSDDIVPHVYEGGFKTWECAVDLAAFLKENTNYVECGSSDSMAIVELGCGSALPTLSVLDKYLSRDSSLSHIERPCSLHICLADYNSQVLELATIPNVLLTVHHASYSSSSSSSSSAAAAAAADARDQPSSDDLEISPSILTSFHETLQANSISLSALSGNWSPDILTHLPYLQQADRVLILASETIYSPSSIDDFSRTILAILRAGNETGKVGVEESASSALKRRCALVAAKKIYFGVGGGVDMFRDALGRMGGVGEVVWETGQGVGVARVILRVTVR